MLIELVLALLLGILAGTFTGLMPGIHINLVAAILLSLAASTLFSFLTPLVMVIFIVSMSITHTFLDFIPSIYLGAPDEDTALSIMPGHELLLQGKAHEALIFTLIGSFSAIFISIIFTPILIFILPKIYPFIQRMMAWILIWASIFLVSREKSSKISALLVFLLSGFLGIATLNLPLNQPLLPLLSGLFGASSLINSISQKITLPEQSLEYKIEKKQIIKPLISTSIASPLCSFLPGLGSSQAAIIGSEIFKLNRKQFLILLGSVNTIIMALSFTTLYIIDKSRTGSAAAIQEIIQLSSNDLTLIFIAIIISAIFSLILAIKISKIFAKNINKISYSKLSYFILGILLLVVLFFSSWLGLLVFLISTTLGLLTVYLGIRKGHLMGCLLVPAILLYIFI